MAFRGQVVCDVCRCPAPPTVLLTAAEFETVLVRKGWRVRKWGGVACPACVEMGRFHPSWFFDPRKHLCREG